MSLPATDNFNRANSGPPMSANWTDDDSSQFTVLNNDGNCLTASATSGSYGFTHWNADTPNADQYSQLIYRAASSGNEDEAAPTVRFSGGNGYAFLVRTDLARIYRNDNYAFTQLQDTGTTFAANDVAKLSISGSTLKAYKTGSQVGTDQSDSTYASAGALGLLARVGGGATQAFDDWEGGNLGAARRFLLVR